MKMRQTPPQSVTVRSEAQLHDFTQEETTTAELETPISHTVMAVTAKAKHSIKNIASRKKYARFP